jgi:hypothetical protein
MNWIETVQDGVKQVFCEYGDEHLTCIKTMIYGWAE